MARRTFEKSSRKQNEIEITRVRDRFLGEASDLPGNEIDKKYQLELINQLCFDSYVKSRPGFVDVTQGMPPFDFFVVDPTSTFSQAATTVTSTGDYFFQSSDVGNYVSFDNADGTVVFTNVKILTVDLGTNTATVDLSQSVTSRIGSVHPKLNGIHYNDFNDVYIVHIGSVLYQASPTSTSWTKIDQVGVLTIPDTVSTFDDDDHLISVIANNVWIIDVVNNLYWQANVDAMVGIGNDVNGVYTRRYLATKSRFVGTDAVYANRSIETDQEIQHETGSTILGSKIEEVSLSSSSADDFVIVGSLKPNGTTYGTLTFRPTLSYFVANTAYAFGISISGVTTTITFTLSSTVPVTVDALASSFASIITAAYPDIQVIFSDPTKVPSDSIMLTTVANYLGYLQAPSSGTDIHGAGALNGTQAAGAQLTTSSSITKKLFASNLPNYELFSFTVDNDPANGTVHVIDDTYTFTSADVGRRIAKWYYGLQGYAFKSPLPIIASVDVGTNTAALTGYSTVLTKQYGAVIGGYDNVTINDPHTHYSIYVTEDLNLNDITTVNHDPNAYAFADDIPIMKAGYGSAMNFAGIILVTDNFHANIVLEQGQWLNTDIGRIAPVLWSFSGSKYMAWAQVLSLVDPRTAYCALTSDGSTIWNYSGVLSNTNYSDAWVVVESRYIVDCSMTGDIVTINNIFDTMLFTNQIASPFAIDIKNSYNISNDFRVGEQVFTADGEIRAITAINGWTLTLDSAVANNRANSTVAIRSLPFNYTDSYTDAQISPNIGNVGIKTRFMRGIPYDSSNTFVGKIIPGFLVAANGPNYYWSELPNNYKYLIGNYNPYHQTDKVLQAITAISSHQDCIGIFTTKATYQVSTNLDLDYTDQQNGTIIRVFASPKQISENYGCNSMSELCETTQGLYAVINPSTADIFLFDGSVFSASLTLNRLRKKIATLYSRTIDYDYQLGLVIRGSLTPSITCLGHPDDDKMYYISLPQNFSVGMGEFRDLPLGQNGIHSVKNNDTTYLYNAQVVLAADGLTYFYPGFFVTLDYNAKNDSFLQAPIVIVSSQTTSDDIGTLQHFFIEQLESHIYLSPDGTNTDPIGGNSFMDNLTIKITAMNDIGQTITFTSSNNNNEDINFDLKIRGHRIRYQIEFSKGGWLLNGLMTYYKSCDKRTPTNASDIEKTMQDVILSPVAGFLRNELLLNAGNGESMVGYKLNGTPTTTGLTRVPGPDGLDQSAAVNNTHDSGLYMTIL